MPEILSLHHYELIIVWWDRKATSDHFFWIFLMFYDQMKCWNTGLCYVDFPGEDLLILKSKFKIFVT